MRVKLATLFAVLQLRSKGMREELTALAEERRNELLQASGVPPETRVGATLDDEIKALQMVRLSEDLTRQAGELLTVPWVLLRNRSGLPFCLADYPFGFVHGELAIPISSELALQFEDKPLTVNSAVRNIDMRQVRDINYAQVDSAIQFIYGSQPCFKWADKYLKGK